MAQLSADSVERIVAFVRDGKSEKVLMSDALALADLMAKSFNGVFEGLDEALHRDFSDIASAIADMRQQIGRLQAKEMTGVRIPHAGRELEAIVEATESATHAIMETAEELMSHGAEDGLEGYKADVDAACMQIFESCAFQDITGQRVAKVVDTLKMIEERVSHFAERIGAEDQEGPVTEDEAAREKRKADLILHGPQLDGDGHDQSSVDDLFDSLDGDSQSQADIDSLFD